MSKLRKRIVVSLGALALILVLGTVAFGTAFAQSDTPTPAPDTTSPKTREFGLRGFGRGWGFGGGSTATFDAIAEALNLTPTELFEQLHSGKTLEEVAAAQDVDIETVKDAMAAARKQATADAIARALEDGRITQAQADWLLQGLENGYLDKGGFGFGHGMRGRGGMRGHGFGGTAPDTGTRAPGTTES